MTSPCKDCKRRKVGCHNVEKCKEWSEYVQMNQARLAAKYEAHEETEDIKRHMRRHGHRITDKSKG